MASTSTQHVIQLSQISASETAQEDDRQGGGILAGTA